MAEYLPKDSAGWAAILAAGLERSRNIALGEVDRYSDLVDRLAELPSPEEILALKPSVELSERTEELIEKFKANSLSEAESEEWKGIERLEHLMRMAKAKAAIKLGGISQAA
ncbi:MAG: hypothetical protein KDM63_21560 [Verrucomicrobiae bacterium]|nr:hypothetical protein [Verrucomicrobiae bacterium]MCB1089642.1 hypothetical protein [Verrucomicrobiae bacterium]